MNEDILKTFYRINDREVGAVSFVRDYYEFHFVNGYLRFIGDTTIGCDQKRFSLPSDVGHLALITLIGHSIDRAVIEGTIITFYFENGWDLSMDFESRAPSDNLHIGYDKKILMV